MNMNENQTSSRRTPKRYRRHSTKRRSVFRPPAHPGRLIAIILAVVAVVTLALVWGNALKRQSDAYRAAKEAGEWTLPPEEEGEVQSTTVPAVHAREINPQGNVGDIVISGAYEGVMLPLRDADGGLHYRSETATAAGISLSGGAPSLSEDVARIARRELRVTGIFYVTCFDADGTSMQTYLRGLELALLCEYAASGIDDILLVGLSCGNDGDDALAVAFLQDLKALLSTVDNPPEVGVALPLAALPLRRLPLPGGPRRGCAAAARAAAARRAASRGAAAAGRAAAARSRASRVTRVFALDLLGHFLYIY